MLAKAHFETGTKMAEIPHTKDMFDRLTMGIVRSLEKRPGVRDVRLRDRKPAERHIIVSWEQKNSCMLPDDLKRFYLTTDGMLLQWNIKFDDQGIQIGRMEINAIANVTKIGGTNASRNTASLGDVDYDTDEDSSTELEDKPHFDTRSRAFELDPCEGYGKVCLVYKNTKPGSPAQHPQIWFLDRSLAWHFLADNFMQYFRLMLMHLGLPQWQYTFTDIGLSPSAKQWFNMYAPMRLNMDSELKEQRTHDWQDSNSSAPSMDMPVNKLDAGKIFKGKSDKKSKSTAAKKKPSSTSTSSKPSSSGPGGGGRSIQSQTSAIGKPR
ncbi:tubulin polyglutamylase complex subunit 2-like isoform X1 [Ptychodera flava]|uniref:tubulin polyglutamylase complex subunit 2-like isoform X1 n=1 Tax=Ptychodera flava TaxID=63121 RepID=UPI00396A9545